MRLKAFVAILAAVALVACDSPTASTCDAVQHRVVSMSGDTAQTVTSLRYIDFEVGTGTEVRSCSNVEVRYTGYLTNGTVFDQGVIPVVPGRRVGGRVIPGFEQALIGMRVGGKRRALIPSFLAYGAAGSPPRIPPNADLIFDIEVLSVAD